MFSPREVKAQIVNRMPEGYFRKLLKKGWDPGYFVEIAPDDFVTLGQRLLKIVDRTTMDAGNGQTVTVEAQFGRERVVILSKGWDDPDRRIIARGDWVVGLWISLLRRQIKGGCLNVQAWSFETLTSLERDDAYFRTQADNWTRELLQKEAPEV